MAAPRSHGFERPWQLLPLLLWTLLWQPAPVNAAPYLPGGFPQQSQAHTPLDFVSPIKGGMIGPLFRPNDQTAVELHPAGCYYQFHHYEEGDRIITNEPCLNCTCHNSMLMCYLKVCPFSKPIGFDCTIEKSPDQCCPVIICPQVPVNLQVMHMTTTTTASPEMEMMGIVPYVEHGCTMEGDYYPDGAQVPGDPSKPCELCYCIRNHTACIMQECILKVEGCVPVFQESICCPVRYQCEEGDHPIFPQIAASDPYATVVYQYTDRPSSPHTYPIPEEKSTIPPQNPAQSDYPQTDEPPETRTGLDLVLNDLLQFFTGTGGRKSKVAHEEGDTFLTTTLSPSTAPINATTGLPTTTMVPGGVAGGCTHLGEFYADGASITTEDPCEHCYCMKGDLVCAIHDCKSSLDEDDEGCVPQPPLPGQCCPQAYDCPDQPETTTLISGVTSTMTETTASPTSATIPDETKEGVDEKVTIKESGSATSVTAGEHITSSTDAFEDEQPSTTEQPSKLVDTSVQYELETSDQPVDEDLKTRITIGETFQTDPSDEETPVDGATLAVEDLATQTDADSQDDDKTTPMISGIATTEQDISTATESSADKVESSVTGTVSPVVGSTSSTTKPGVTGSTGDETDATSPETIIEGGVTPSIAEETPPEDLPEDILESTAAPGDVDATTAAPAEEIDTTEETQPSTDAPAGEISSAAVSTATEATSVPSTEVAEGVTSSPDAETDTTEGAALPDGVTDTTEKISLPVSVTDAPAVSSPDAATDAPDGVSSTDADTDTTEEDPSPDTVTETPEDIAVTDSDATSSAKDKPEVVDATSSTEPSVEEDISTSTSSSIVPDITEITPGVTGIPGEGDCMIDETNYQSGDDIPTSSVCEESCTCRDSVVVCKFKPCPAAPPAFLRCTPSEQPGECCPSYECPVLESNTTCVKNGATYENGVSVPSADICTDCFCVDGDIICAELECRPPSAGCVVTRLSIDSCCPVEYECTPTTPESASQVTSTDKPATDGDIGKTDPSTDSSDLAQTESPAVAATVDPAGCSSNGVLYGEGDIVPSASSCQVNCTCMSGEVQCRQRACPPAPPAFLRCIDVGNPMECCPTFACPSSPASSTATCQYGGQTFKDGERVPTFDVCEDCYCLESDVVCAQQECVAPEGSCVPVEVPGESCCPTSYDCTDVSAPEISASPEFTVGFTDEATQSPTSETEGASLDEELGTSAITKDGTDTYSLPNATATTKTTSVTDAATAEVDSITEATSVQPDTETTQPGDQVTMTEKESSTEGKPVSGADLVTEIPAMVETGVTEETTSTYSVDDETVVDTELATDSPTDGVTETPIAESTKPSVDETSDADDGEVTVSITDEVTEATIDGATDGRVTEPPVDVATETTSIGDVTDISIDDATEISMEDATETSIAGTTKPSVGQTVGVVVDETTEQLIDTITHEPSVETSESYGEGVTDASPDTSTESPMSETTESSVSDGTEPDEVETESPSADPDSTEPTITEDFDQTESSVVPGDNVTESPIDKGTCEKDGEIYADGDSVQRDNRCQDRCVCKNSVIECEISACPPAPPAVLRCSAVETQGQCCPSYDCQNIKPGGPANLTCQKDGVEFANGQFVPSPTLCTDCYCIDGEVVCATIECHVPAGNCASLTIPEGSCCPEKYVCTPAEDKTEPSSPTPEVGASVTAAPGTGTTAPGPGATIPGSVTTAPGSGTTAPGSGTTAAGSGTTAPGSGTTAPGSGTTALGSGTTAPDSGTTGPVSDSIGQSCSRDGILYSDGQSVPVSSSCQEGCTCSNGMVQCSLLACPPAPPAFLRCTPHEQSISCCPIYDCPSGAPDSTLAPGCEQNGLQFSDGELVPSSDQCQDCYCLEGEVVCATLECQPPAGQDCVPSQWHEGSCCPSQYECNDFIPTFGLETSDGPDITFSDIDETTGPSTDATAGATEAPQSETSTSSAMDEETTDAGEESTDSSAIGSPEVTTVSTDDAVDGVTETPTTVPPMEEGDCLRDQVYSNGSSVPAVSPCEEACVCLDGSVQCDTQACPPPPPAFLRCSPIEQAERCCPSYDCISSNATDASRCEKNGNSYAEGEYVPSQSYCTDCYCVSGKVVCAIIDCEAPGENCLPIEIPEGSCCPTRYSCSDAPPTLSPGDLTFFTEGLSTRQTIPGVEDSDATPTLPEGESAVPTDTTDDPDSTTTAPGPDAETTPAPDSATTDAAVDSEVTDADEPTLPETGTQATVSEDVSTDLPPEESTDASTDESTGSAVTDAPTPDEPVASTSFPTETDASIPDSTEPTDQAETTDGVEPSESTAAPSEGDETVPEITESTVQAETTEGEQLLETTVTPSKVEIPDSTDPTVIILDTDAVTEVTPETIEGMETTESDAETATDVTESDVSEKTTETSVDTATDSLSVDATTSVPDTETVEPTDSVTEPSKGSDCVQGDQIFLDGDSLPTTSECQEGCSCINGTIQCEQFACAPAPPAFFKCTQTQTDNCCPSYDCVLPTVPSTNGSATCQDNGMTYSEGQFIPSETLCTDCYCIDGEKVCATIECTKPGANCVASERLADSCCPTKYICDESVAETSEVPPSTVDSETSTDAATSAGTATPPSVEGACIVDGKQYADGQFIPSESLCKDCFCFEGETICSEIECALPGENCTVLERSDLECCPTKYECDGVPTTATFGAPPTTVEVKFTETPYGETLETRDTDQPRDSTTDGPESESSVTSEGTADLTTVGPTEVETTEDIVSSEPDVTTAPVDETTPQPQEVSESDLADVTESDVTSSPTEEVTEASTEPEDTIDVTEEIPTASVTSSPPEEVTDGSTEPDDTIDVTEEIPTASEGSEPSSSTSPDTIEDQTTDSPQTVTEEAVKDTTETVEGVTDDSSSTASSILVDVTTPSSQEDVTETTSDSLSETTVSGLDCVVDGKTYTEGETIPSPSECQENCTCTEGKLKCQVVACPPAPPAFLRCIAVKEESSGCCPTYECPTSPNPEMLPMCVQNGQKFLDGESVPGVDVCSDCFCIEGEVVCATLECSAPGPRCTPAAVPEGVCCPASYDCVEDLDAMTTIAPGDEDSLVTSTTPAEAGQSTCFRSALAYGSGETVPVQSPCEESCTCTDGEVMCLAPKCPEKPPAFLKCTAQRSAPNECCPSYVCPDETTPEAPGCQQDGVFFPHGQYVNSSNICTDCYCIDGAIVCATLECQPPMPRCTAASTSPQECCPTSYVCPEDPGAEETTGATTESSEDVTEFPTEGVEDLVTSATEHPLGTVETSSTDSGSEIETTESPEISSATQEPSTVSEAVDSTESQITDDTVTETGVSSTEPPVTTGDETTSEDSAYATESSSTKPTVITDEELSSETPIDEQTGVPTEETPEALPDSGDQTGEDSTTETAELVTESEPITTSAPTGTTGDVDSTVPETIETVKSTGGLDDSTDSPVDDVTATLSPVDIESEISTEAEQDREQPAATTPAYEIDAYPCKVNDSEYSDGDAVPSLGPCQHSCKCVNGTVKCERQSCPPNPPQFLRCSPVPEYTEDEQCCPVYSCPPASGSQVLGTSNCTKDGQEYEDGAFVPSPTQCTDCYCIDGVIVCAELDCGVPGPNCEPVYHEPGSCCASTYECQETAPGYPTGAPIDPIVPGGVTYTQPDLESSVTIDELKETDAASEVTDQATTATPSVTAATTKVTQPSTSSVKPETGKPSPTPLTTLTSSPGVTGTIGDSIPSSTIRPEYEESTTESSPGATDDISSDVTFIDDVISTRITSPELSPEDDESEITASETTEGGFDETTESTQPSSSSTMDKTTVTHKLPTSVSTESSISDTDTTKQEDLPSTPEVFEETGSKTTERGQLDTTKTTPSETSSDDDVPTSVPELTTVSRPIILPGVSVTEKLPQPDDKITDSPTDPTESTVADAIVDLTVKTSDVTDSPSTPTKGLESTTDKSKVSEKTTESVAEMAESTDTIGLASSEPAKTSTTPLIPELSSSYAPTITSGDLVTEETLSTRNESSEVTKTTAKPTGSTQGLTITEGFSTPTTTEKSQTTPLDSKYPTILSSTFEDSESTVADDYVTETTIMKDGSRIPSVVTESTVQTTSPSRVTPTSADSVTDKVSTRPKPTSDVTEIDESKQTTLDDLRVTTESGKVTVGEELNKTSTVSDIRETSEPEATGTTLTTSDKPVITQTTPAALTTADEIDVTDELFSTRITSPEISPEEEKEAGVTSSPIKPSSDVTVVDDVLQTTSDESRITTESSMSAVNETSTKTTTTVSDVRETSDPQTTDDMLTDTTLVTSSKPLVSQTTPSVPTTADESDVTDEFISTRITSPEISPEDEEETSVTSSDESRITTESSMLAVNATSTKTTTTVSDVRETSDPQATDDMLTDTTLVTSSKPLVSQTTPSVPTTADESDVTDEFISTRITSPEISPEEEKKTDVTSSPTKPTSGVTIVDDSRATTSDESRVTTESSMMAVDKTSAKTPTTVSDIRETSDPQETDIMLTDTTLVTSSDESRVTTESSMLAVNKTSTKTSTTVSDVRETSDPDATVDMLTDTTLVTSAKPLVSQTTPAVPTTADEADVTDEFISTRITSPEISPEEEKETHVTSSPTKPTSDVTIVDDVMKTTSDESRVTTESSMMAVDKTSTKTSTTVSDVRETSDPQATDDMLTDTTLVTSSKPLVSQTTPAVPTTVDEADVTDEYISTRITSPEISPEEEKETDVTSSPTKPTSGVTIVDDSRATTSDESRVTTESSMSAVNETSTKTSTTVSDVRETSDPEATDDILTDTTLVTSAKPLVSQTTPAVPTTADEADVTDEFISTRITSPEISTDDEKETNVTSFPTKPASDVTIVDEVMQTTSDESRVTTESSMVAVDETSTRISTTVSDVRETSDPQATDIELTDTTLVTSAKPLVSQTTPAVPTTADETDVTDEFISTRITSPEISPEDEKKTDTPSPETLPDVFISSTSPPKTTIGVGDLITDDSSKASSVDGETITSLPTASIPSESTITTKQPSTAVSSTVPSIITISQAETVESSSSTSVEAGTTDGVKFPTSAVSSSTSAPVTSVTGYQTTEKATSEVTVATSQYSSSVASTASDDDTGREPSTTSPSTPPPLYQTPKPETAVTGYTSPFPLFPGGMFPSTTTWKPSTTQDLVLGPGACMFDGKVYVSAQQILRDDPCDFCFCFRGDIICLQQSCPPPVPGCFEEPIPGFCCPRYECPLTKAIVNITTTTTPIPTYPPLQRAEEIIMCEIGDKYYHTGEIVEEASGPCLECRCGNDGMMECDPKECPASPMLGKLFRKGSSLGYQT